jgi:hypothetical protein
MVCVACPQAVGEECGQFISIIPLRNKSEQAFQNADADQVKNEFFCTEQLV